MKTKPKKRLRGKALFNAALAWIERHPTRYKQNIFWHCRTSHCFGGICQILAGFKANRETCLADATRALGIEPITESDKLFPMFITLAEIRAFKPKRWKPTI